MLDSERASEAPKFSLGAQVRAKSGVTHPRYSDVPLDNVTGTVNAVHQEGEQPQYIITLSPQALMVLNPEFRERCERDGISYRVLRLSEGDIESDMGRQGLSS